MSEAKRIIALIIGLAMGLPVLGFLAYFVWYILPFIPMIADVIGLVVGLVITASLYQGWHYVEDQRKARKVNIQYKTAELSLVQSRYEVLQIATTRGFNIKITPEAMEVINPISLMPASMRNVVESVNAPMLSPQTLLLPGACDFTDILNDWQPSVNEILLALGPGGQRLIVPMKALCHVALAGATGNGKSVLMRLLLSQVLAVGARVALADPHYADVDPESGEDWRPIRARLAMEPVVQYEAISDMLVWLAQTELPNRLEKRRNGVPLGSPFFLALDELPAIVKNVPDAPEHLGDILREGRKVGLFLISAAQDFLVKTIGGTGAVRDCFRTAFYVGGDATSARVLLDVKGNVDDGGLGKGIVMLRSIVTQQATKVRVPYVTNEALYDLLPLSTASSISNATAFPTARPLHSVSVEGAFAVDYSPLHQRDTDPVSLDARSLRVREMVRDGTSPSKIIEEVWGINAKQGGNAYKTAAQELSSIMQRLV